MAPIRITLKEKDLAGIKQLMKKGDVNVRIIKRAQILKFRHHGLGTDEIVELLDVDPKLISITLNNYLEFGLKVTIEDAPRTGRPIHFDARDRSNIVALVCSEPPEGFARWTVSFRKLGLKKIFLSASVKDWPQNSMEAIFRGRPSPTLGAHAMTKGIFEG